jgi:hypothetical protein
MKLSQAFSELAQCSVSAYEARDLYTDEDSTFFGKLLTFRCEDPACRVPLTPVGVYMTRKSKRVLHFRTGVGQHHVCGVAPPASPSGSARAMDSIDDEYQVTQFPTELDLSPRRRARTELNIESPVTNVESAAGEPSASAAAATVDATNGVLSDRTVPRRTATRTRYLDYVVHCFLSDDDVSKQRLFTIAEKTKPFARFFKKIQFFGDEAGLIYYGAIDELKRYNNAGIGLRFTQRVWVDQKPFRIRAYLSQEHIDASPRKRAFLAEIEELEQAVKIGEEVHAYFVGAYPTLKTLTSKQGETFSIYSADLISVDHLSLVFGLG